MKKFPFYRQLDQMDCGPTCLKMIAKHYGKVYDREFLRQLANITRDGVSLGGIAEAAEKIGFQSLAVNVTYETLALTCTHSDLDSNDHGSDHETP